MQLNMFDHLPQNEILVISYYNKPVPIAYMNVYEPGDMWKKINSCLDCPEENRERCCGRCAMYTPKGCMLHLQSERGSNKPYRCVVCPSPNITRSFCALEFECIKGEYKGMIRKLNSPDFVEKIN